MSQTRGEKEVIHKKDLRNAIVLCNDAPDLAEISNFQNIHVIFLGKGAYAFRHDRLEANITTSHFSEFIKKEDYKSIDALVHGTWEQMLTINKGLANLDAYIYIFRITLTPYLFWRTAVERCLKTYCSGEEPFIFTALCEEAFIKYLSEDEYEATHAWLSARAINDALQRLKKESQALSTLNRRKAGITNIYHSVWLRRIGAVIEKLDRGESLAWGILRKAYFSSFKPALAIAQETKFRRLRRSLSIQGFAFELMSYAKLDDQLRCGQPVNIQEFRFPVPSPQSNCCTDKLLLKWLIELCRHHDKYIEPQIQRLLSNYSFVVTDGVHHPLIRRLSRYIASSESHVICAIPEGAVDWFRSHASEKAGWQFKPHQRLMQCVISQHAEVRLKKRRLAYKEVLNVGYSTKLNGSKIYGDVLRLALRAWPNKAKRKLIFLDCPCIIEGMGIVRTDQRSGYEHLQGLEELISKVPEDYTIIVNSIRLVDQVYNIIKGRALIIPLHWSILAAASDCVISSDSSIIYESLSIKRNVIVWNYQNKTINHFEDIANDPLTRNTIQIASSGSELTVALSKIGMRESFIPAGLEDWVTGFRPKPLERALRDL